jgi:cell division septation protein DedD
MVVFGAGFIVGMGYKANEQISPYVVNRPLTAESSEQQGVSSAVWKGQSLTFYDSLIKKDGAVEMNPAAETTQTPAPAPAPIPASPVESVAVAEGTDPQSVEEDAATETVQAPTTPAVAPPPIVVAEETNPDPQATDSADASTLGTDESLIETYSVQVASFLAPERAERLIEDLAEKGYRAYVHPFEAPGKPSWYRVKVGKFTDRATANRVLEKIGKPDAMITRD